MKNKITNPRQLVHGVVSFYKVLVPVSPAADAAATPSMPNIVMEQKSNFIFHLFGKIVIAGAA